MELVFMTPGVYINVKDGLFSISLENEKTTVSPVKVERVILTTEAVITTAVVKLCAENNIDLVVLDRYGDPVGRFWHSKFGSIASKTNDGVKSCITTFQLQTVQTVHKMLQCKT